jgi:dUTP pyrophosphatase
MKIKVKKLNEKAVLPKYAHVGEDAAMDVVAISKNKTEKYIEYGTGLSFELPTGYVMLIFPRSSVSKTDLVQANCVGVLDSGYRGELMIRFKKFGDEDYEVGDRIAQIMVLPYPEIKFEEADNLTDSQRGAGGWGSTGKN